MVSVVFVVGFFRGSLIVWVKASVCCSSRNRKKRVICMLVGFVWYRLLIM